MKRFGKSQPTVKSFQDRLGIAMLFVLVCFSLLLLRFIWLQVVTHHRHSVAAENNRIALVPVPANRGLITDRNGIVIARNYSAYTLEITPSQIETSLNDLLDELPVFMNDDFSTAKVLANLFELAPTINSIKDGHILATAISASTVEKIKSSMKLWL